jgi:pimeloyl-ACP methyl ester carboxylesterase
MQLDAYDYGHYGLARLLIPGFNSRQIDHFYEWYSQMLRHHNSVDLNRYDKRPSVVAHSFGSWIVGYAMLKYEDIKFDKIILFGCILPRDFDWGRLFARDQVAFVRNECGLKDPWPKWASRFVRRAGRAGFEGFDWFSNAVENVFLEFGHSDAQRRKHIGEYWRPFLFQQPSPLGLLHGRNIQQGSSFAEIFRQTGEIDDEVFGRITQYDSCEPSDELALEWVTANPDIYTFLVDRKSQRTVGYLNAMPVTDLYSNIRSGRVAAAQLKIYLMSIAINKEYRRWGDGLFQQAYIQLIAGFLDKLGLYAKRERVKVTHFLATAWTTEGHQICTYLGMKVVGADRFGETIYELELACPDLLNKKSLPSALRRLLRMYRNT